MCLSLKEYFITTLKTKKKRMKRNKKQAKNRMQEEEEVDISYWIGGSRWEEEGIYMERESRIHEEGDWELSQWMLNILTKVFQMCVIFVKFEKESEEEAEEIIII